MDPGSIADWTGVFVNGVAILAAAAIAVYVPRRERQVAAERERRARLEVHTTLYSPEGLKVEVRYRPEFSHAGIFAEITLLEPERAVLLRAVAVRATAPLASGRNVHFQVDGIDICRQVTIQLNQLDNEIPLIGAVLIQPFTSGGIQAPQVAEAKIKVLIRDQHGERLIAQTLTISAIDGARILPAS